MDDSPRRSPRGQVRRSIGAPVPLSSSSVSNTSSTRIHSTKRNSIGPSSSTNENKDRPHKLSRHSVGGEKLRREDLDAEATSRRHVVGGDCYSATVNWTTDSTEQPGPRKSSIRSAPPQKFESPTNLEIPPVPIKRPLVSSSSLGSIEALGGAELVEMMDLAVATSPGKSRNRTRKSASSALRNVTTNLTSYGSKSDRDEGPLDEPTEVRRQRRVTFNPIQEKTAFERDEPTMRLRPIGEPEPMPPADESLSTSQASSNGSSNMDIDSDSISDSDSDDLDSDSESEEEEEVDRALSTEPVVAQAITVMSGRREDHTGDATRGSDMDLTSAYMRDSTRHSMQSEGDASVTMDFTVARGRSLNDTRVRRASTLHNDDTMDTEADGGDTMELTGTFGGIRDKTRRSSVGLLEQGEGDEQSMEFTQPLGELEEEREDESHGDLGSEIGDDDASSIDMDVTGDATGMEMTQLHGRIITSPTKRMVTQPATLPLSMRHLSSSPDKGQATTIHVPRPTSPSKTPRAQLNVSPTSPHKHSSLLPQATPTAAIKGASRVSAPTSPSRKGHEYCNKSVEETPPQKMMSEATRKSLARREGSSTPTAKLHANSSSVTEANSSPNKQAKSPTRFRQSLRGGHPSPGYVHSPARRISVPRPLDQPPINPGFPTPRPLRTSHRASEVHDSSIAPALDSESVPQTKPVSMKDFFEKIDVGFLELDRPVKKPLTARPSGQDRVDNSSRMVQATAGVLPMLDSLLEACEVIKQTVDDGRDTAAEHEKSFVARPPAYVGDFLAITSPTDKANAIASFKVQKSAARARARMSYYGWRADIQFDDGTLQRLRDAREGLQEDLKVIDNGKALVGRVLPNLRERHAELKRQLELERKRKAAIEGGDQTAMMTMHNDIEEVAGFLREYEAEYKNRKEELSRVRARLTEQQDKQRLTRDAIDEAHEAAEAIRDCTESEAERLARELQQQEKLHGWKLKRLDGRVLEMVLENRVEVRFDISPTTGSLKTLRLQPAKGSTFDIFEEFTSEALSRKLVAESHTLESEWKVNEAIRIVTVAWVRRRQLAWMRDLLTSHFPTDVDMYDGQIRLCATVLMPKVKSKVLIKVLCGIQSLVETSEPLFDSNNVWVDKIYGPVDSETVTRLIRDRLTTCDLATACLEAVSALDG